MKTIEEYYYMYKIVIAARFENLKTEGYEVFLDNGNDGFDIQFFKLEKIEFLIIGIQSAVNDKIDKGY